MSLHENVFSDATYNYMMLTYNTVFQFTEAINKYTTQEYEIIWDSFRIGISDREHSYIVVLRKQKVNIESQWTLCPTCGAEWDNNIL